MANNQSVAALLTVTFVAWIAGYTRGVYTQVNPSYDQAVREHFSWSEQVEVIDDWNYPLRPVTINHTTPWISHGSAEQEHLLMTVKENTVEILSEWEWPYELRINETSVWIFEERTFSLPEEFVEESMKIQLIDTNWRTATAYISN